MLHKNYSKIHIYSHVHVFCWETEPESQKARVADLFDDELLYNTEFQNYPEMTRHASMYGYV